ncbi:hypothetical protein HGRIS_000123 [Hohenbuehelia grisea]|uniref:F-box domain-containing protein n=1 Tax=Hohenbuehelia grisea TaxID=104357 RepID=A0ABR3JQ99_9AGAR
MSITITDVPGVHTPGATKNMVSLLPIEMLVYILEELEVDLQALLRCRLVCKLFQQLIDNNANLQYKIALREAYQKDGPPGPDSSASRLEKLRAHQTAWSSFSWSSVQDFETPLTDRFQLEGNVIAELTSEGTGVKFIQLPSVLRGIPMREWTVDVGVLARDFFIDPDQNLLVLLEAPLWDSESFLHRLHLRTMTDGQQHPLAAASPLLRRSHKHEHHEIFYISEIYGSSLAILVSDFDEPEYEQHDLNIYNWKTGNLMKFISTSNLPMFSFLDEQNIIIVALDFHTHSFYLFVYDCTGKDAEEFHLEKNFRCRLEFPIIYPDFDVEEISIQSHPSPRYPPQYGDIRPPFSGDRLHNIFNIELKLSCNSLLRRFNLFVPTSTFHKAIGSAAPYAEARVPWVDWGTGCYLVNIGRDFEDVHGMKLVDLHSDTGKVEIWDFNPYAAHRTRQVLDSLENRIPDSPRRPDAYIDIFRDPILTCAPFRVFKHTFTESFIILEVLISEDSVVLIHDDGFRILTF